MHILGAGMLIAGVQVGLWRPMGQRRGKVIRTNQRWRFGAFRTIRRLHIYEPARILWICPTIEDMLSCFKLTKPAIVSPFGAANGEYVPAANLGKRPTPGSWSSSVVQVPIDSYTHG